MSFDLATGGGQCTQIDESSKDASYQKPQVTIVESTGIWVASGPYGELLDYASHLWLAVSS